MTDSAPTATKLVVSYVYVEGSEAIGDSLDASFVTSFPSYEGASRSTTTSATADLQNVIIDFAFRDRVEALQGLAHLVLNKHMLFGTMTINYCLEDVDDDPVLDYTQTLTLFTTFLDNKIDGMLDIYTKQISDLTNRLAAHERNQAAWETLMDSRGQGFVFQELALLREALELKGIDIRDNVCKTVLH